MKNTNLARSAESLTEDVNQQARLELCGVELKALEQFKAHGFTVEANIHHVAHYAMNFALIHPEQFTRWLRSVKNYSDAEGIGQFPYMRSRLVARYRGRKLKLIFVH